MNCHAFLHCSPFSLSWDPISGHLSNAAADAFMCCSGELTQLSLLDCEPVVFICQLLLCSCSMCSFLHLDASVLCVGQVSLLMSCVFPLELHQKGCDTLILLLVWFDHHLAFVLPTCSLCCKNILSIFMKRINLLRQHWQSNILCPQTIYKTGIVMSGI